MIESPTYVDWRGMREPVDLLRKSLTTYFKMLPTIFKLFSISYVIKKLI
jgi:hypothetical protein